MKRLLLGTDNQAKLREYRGLLLGIPFVITTLRDEGIEARVKESGTTMEENATMKATTYATMSGLLTLADDSGLEVDALGGEPGVLSARYAGDFASDRERIDYLLARMERVPWERRGARFRCIIAIASPSDDVELCQGECQGVIAFDPKGGNGFGYDPVFYLPDLGRTMAELTMEEKNRISHRGMAAWRARQVLGQLGR